MINRALEARSLRRPCVYLDFTSSQSREPHEDTVDTKTKCECELEFGLYVLSIFIDCLDRAARPCSRRTLVNCLLQKARLQSSSDNLCILAAIRLLCGQCHTISFALLPLVIMSTEPIRSILKTGRESLLIVTTSASMYRIRAQSGLSMSRLVLPCSSQFPRQKAFLGI